MKKLFALCLSLTLMLVACGSPESQIKGHTYKFIAEDAKRTSKHSMTIQFFNDGTMTNKMEYDGTGLVEEEKGKYHIKDNKLTITYEGANLTFNPLEEVAKNKYKTTINVVEYKGQSMNGKEFQDAEGFGYYSVERIE
ncbi:copper resistance protein NlpE [Macrococcoides canis]|uniref:copper resistance protein NlpE n=1 Tax=Macrococcoides canis TaxID=1855823 RepID=UPI0010FBE287|nr:copper resistance protein NlpE [Macrococcus canis]QCT74184.1 hypothetical protein EST43_02580 [Macrococcus canis]